MIMTLTKVTGEKLTLLFGPDGALSSAKLCGCAVTSELRYVREDNYLDMLKVFGYQTDWSNEMLELVVQPFVKRLNKAGFKVAILVPLRNERIELLLTKDNEQVHPIIQLRAMYNIEARCVEELTVSPVYATKELRQLCESLAIELCKIE